MLKDKLRRIKMEKGNNISTYLNKFNTCKDELGSVGITTVDDDMVSLALLGLPKSWTRLCEWKGETVGLGTTVVKSDVGGDQEEHMRWFFI